MRKDDFFKLERGNIFATTDDDVFFSVHDEEVAVLVHGGHIAGVEPAAAQGFGGGVRLSPIAFHDAVTARDDFANGVAVAGNVTIVGIHNAQLDAGNCKARHRLVGVALLALPVHSDLHG